MILNIGGGGGVKPRIVVTAPTGSDVTVSKGTTILYAPEVSGTWTFNVPEQGDWSATAILGSKTASKTVTVGKVGVYSVTLRYISTTLNDNSWEDIKGMADASAGQNYWAVGDTKQIALNGKVSDGLTLTNYSTWVYIIGFDHNASVEGTGISFGGFKTSQTSGVDVAMCDSEYDGYKGSGQWFNMNNEQPNTGGWSSSRMRSTTLPLVKSALPSELTSVIKTTSIYSDNTGGGSDTASYVTATQDDLYLLAEWEIFGARSFANSAERNYQQQYAYYIAGNSKVKYRHNSTATAVNWWERSVCAEYSNRFCNVNASGAATNYITATSYGLAPAFKVGSNPPPQPISALAVGSSVFCNVSGTKKEFIVVHHGNPDTSIYDSSCDGTWLLQKEPSGFGIKWAMSTGTYYNQSNIKAYMSEAIDEIDIKDIIKTVKIPWCAYGSTYHTLSDGDECKGFPLSMTEVGLTSSDLSYVPDGDGAKLDYFESGTGSSANEKRLALTDIVSRNWWTRSIRTDNNAVAWFIYMNGGGNSANVTDSDDYRYRVAFIIPSDTEIDFQGNIIID